MFFVFALARRAIHRKHDAEHVNQPTYATSAAPQAAAPYAQYGYAQPQPRRSCCHQRKAERRVERQIRRDERSVQRAERRGGCSGRRRHHVHQPVVAVEPAYLYHNTQPQMAGPQRHHQAQMNGHMPTQGESVAMGSANGLSRGRGTDQPPSYEELDRKGATQ